MQNDKRAWIILIFLALVWGSSFILIKKSMFPFGQMVLDPYQMGALRIVIAGLILMPFSIRSLKHLTRKDFFLLLVVGVCGNFLPATLFSLAGAKIDSSLSGMLNMGSSFFVVIISIVFYKSNPTRYQVLGILFGATGLYLILRSQIEFNFREQIGYALLVLLATVMYATSLTTIKFRLQHLSAITITSLAFFMIFWPALACAFWFDAFTPIAKHPEGLHALGFLVTLAAVGTALAVFLFNKLVSISNAIFASGVTYLMPVVAILMGVLDGDTFKPINILWIILIITGVWLLNKGPKKLAK